MTPTGETQPRWKPAPGLWVQGGESGTGNQADFLQEFWVKLGKEN